MRFGGEHHDHEALGRWWIDCVIDKGVHVYATNEDFCRVFPQDMARLYPLALLLTANRHDAEQCFIAALDDCMQMNSVFNKFAKSWCRRAIIKNAIQRIRPGVSGERRNEDVVHLNDQLAAVTRLEAFGRFVFVISILEGCSDHECSILLDSTRADVIRARVCALHQLNSIQRFESQTEEIMGAVEG
jgi:hypothetical protein